MEITRKLEEVYAQLKGGEHNLANVAVEASCVAKFSEDESWYRAVIKQVGPRQVVVKFIGK